MKSVACPCLVAMFLLVKVVVAAQEHNGPYEDDSGWEHATAEAGHDSHHNTPKSYSYENDWKNQIMYASAGSQSSVNMAMSLAFAVMVIVRVALR